MSVTAQMALSDAERLRRAVEDGVLDEVLTPESRRALIEAAGRAR